MTWDGVQERRRGPRVAVGQQVDCRFEMRVKVRVVDISATGALLEADESLPVQTGGRLKAVLGASRFSPHLQIQRAASLLPDGGVHLGAAFVRLDDDSRNSLEAFLKRAIT